MATGGALCPGEVASIKFKVALCNVSSWPARGSLLVKSSLPLSIQQCPAKETVHFGFIKRRVQALIVFSHPNLDCRLVIFKVVIYQYC